MQSVKRHTHTQSTPSTTWNIAHNLNTLAPAVDCWITVSSVTQKIIPLSIVITDANNVVVSFSSPRSGKAGLR